MPSSRPVQARYRGGSAHAHAGRFHTSLLAFLLSLSAPALAQTASKPGVDAPASDEQLALSVLVSGSQVLSSACSAAPCATAGATPVSAPKELAKETPVVVVVDLGKKRHAVHVRWGAEPKYDAEKRRWDATGPSYHLILAAPLAGSGGAASGGTAPRVIYQGYSDRFEGVEGERHAERVEVLGARTGVQQILVGELREDLLLCGRPALLSVRALDAATLELKPALFQRLSVREQNEAVRLTATPAQAAAADAVLLTADGASSAIGKPSSASDGNLETTWSEGRGKAGTGEFITFRAPSDVELGAFELVLRPPSGGPATGAAPAQLFLVSPSDVVKVELPADAWTTPGARFRVDLPKAWKASCVGVVLGDAPPKSGNVDVTIAELVAVPAGEGFTAESLLLDLEKSNVEARRAVSLLVARGPESAKLIAGAFDKASPTAQARMLDVLDQLPCEQAVDGYAVARQSESEDLQQRASNGFVRCVRSASGALTAALGKLGRADVAREARLAAELSVVDPPGAVRELTPRLTDSSALRRRGLRMALAEASRSPLADQEVKAMLGDASLAPRTTTELMRSLGDRLPRYQPEASAALSRILAKNPSLDVRFLLLRPAAYLAERDAKAEKFLSHSISADPSPMVRSAAAEIVGEVGPLSRRMRTIQQSLLAAVDDKNVRVRAAAARSLGYAGYAVAHAPLTTRLEDDPWPLVRIEAAEGLGRLGGDPSLDKSLAEALEEDDSNEVRARAARALGRRGATDHASVVRDVFEDSDVAPEVRREAATALGAMCDQEAVDALTDEAQKLLDPRLEPGARSLASASLRALGKLKPADLAARLAPLTAKKSPPPVHALAQSVLDDAARGGACQKSRAGVETSTLDNR